MFSCSVSGTARLVGFDYQQQKKAAFPEEAIQKIMEFEKPHVVKRVLARL